MKAMFIFSLFPLLALFAQPLGHYSYWFPIIIIGIGGMAGGIGSFLINMGSGLLFDYADKSQMAFMGFQGKEAGYFIIFCICAVAYLLAWCVMKALVPKYKLIEV